MNRNSFFAPHTRHLWAVLALIVVGGGGFLFARSQLLPEGFGRRGQYRADALQENAARPTTVIAQNQCLECHDKVAEERADSLHKAVHCMHCHGAGTEHVAQARAAADSPDLAIAAADKWDGDLLTRADLYTSKDRALCLVCHEAKIGMPAAFKKIDVDRHLEEMGAAEPTSRETCFECHGPHNTAP